MELQTISYYKRRLFVFLPASIIIFGYSSAYSVLVLVADIITPTLVIWWTIGSEAASFVLILALCYLGSQEEDTPIAGFVIYSPSPKRSLVCLFTATVLLMIMISLPVFLLGGVVNSSFSNTLITMCGLAVIVSSSWKIRFSIVAISLILYISSAFYYFDIKINKHNVHLLIQIFSVVLSLAVTLFLTWKGQFNIFPNGTTKKDDTTPASIPRGSPDA